MYIVDSKDGISFLIKAPNTQVAELVSTFTLFAIIQWHIVDTQEYASTVWHSSR